MGKIINLKARENPTCRVGCTFCVLRRDETIKRKSIIVSVERRESPPLPHASDSALRRTLEKGTVGNIPVPRTAERKIRRKHKIGGTVRGAEQLSAGCESKLYHS